MTDPEERSNRLAREDHESADFSAEDDYLPSPARLRFSERHDAPAGVPWVVSELNLNPSGEPRIVGREEHGLSRRKIDPDALKVMYRLLHQGYCAYLVGGGVRDLLLGKAPKDFDVGTDARPEVVRSLFRNSRIIGRRFPINHVYFRGNKIIEVATFRALSEPEPDSETAMLKRDDSYGDAESDARRRDLTINGLFYDLNTFSVIDYVGGIDDLEKGIVRLIGDPDVRVKEDPVRMIRAIRHAARTGFRIEKSTWDAICQHKQLIQLCASARVYEEFVREFRGGASLRSFQLMQETGLLAFLMPTLADAIGEGQQSVWSRLEAVLSGVDMLTRQGIELPAAVLFLAVMINNFPTHLLERYTGSESDRDMLKIWFTSPDRFQQEVCERLSVETEPETGRGESFVDLHTVETHVEHVVTGVFKPLGLSRKERERMERCMSVRYRMFLWEDNPQPIRPHTEHFDDALMLLRLTALDETSLRCLDHWEQVREGRSGTAQGEPISRSGRRRRRRRGGGKGRQRGHNHGG